MRPNLWASVLIFGGIGVIAWQSGVDVATYITVLLILSAQLHQAEDNDQ